MKISHTQWLSLLSIATISVLLAACSGSTARGSASDENSTRINVLVEDFSFSLETSETEAGRVTFEVQNNGAMPHDFAVQINGVERKTPMIEPGESATLTVDLEPGTYTYICTVPGHQQLGMSGAFIVTSN